MSTEIDAGVKALDYHVWDASDRLCACGQFFEASSATIADRKRHVVRAVLVAALRDILAEPTSSDARPGGGS
jgi:vancomycin permeability regulator SanA